MSSWIIVVIIWIVIGLVSSSNSKKKKAAADKKRAERRKMAEKIGTEPQTAQPQPKTAPTMNTEPTPGMSLNEFREQYEKEQAAAKRRQEEIQAEKAAQKQAAERKIVQPSVKTTVKPEAPRVQPTVSEKQPKVHPTVPPGQPAVKAGHEERCAVDIKAQKPIIVETAPPPIKTSKKKVVNKPVDLNAMMQKRGYTPVQQGLIWSEVLAEPKSRSYIKSGRRRA